MKALNKLFIAAIATLAMSACNNELGEQQVNSNGIINFRMGIGTPASSRTAMDDDKYSATFTEGDEVGIFVKEEGSYTNVKYSTEDGSNWTGGSIKAPAEGEFSYTFYAYYPYNENNNDAASITTTVATDQETSGNIKNDFFISTATTSNETVNLSFNHALSLVEVKLTGDGAAKGATVSMLNVATDATIDLTASTVTTGTTKADVTMDALTGVAMKYRVIVPSQEIAANTPIFKIEVNGKTYNASFDSNVKFEQGKYLAMIITLGKEEGPAEIEITTGATINDWTEGDGGDVSVEEEPLIVEFPSEISTISSDNVTGLESSTWFYVINNTYTTTSVTSAETISDITPEWKSQANLTYNSKYVDGSANANNWYSAVIGYLKVGDIKGGIYELSFKAKGSNLYSTDTDEENPQNISTKKAQIACVCKNSDNTGSFGITNNATDTPKGTVSTIDLDSDTWKTCKFYIHFELETNIKSPSSTQDFLETAPQKYSKIQMRIYTNNKATESEPNLKTSISITDVKLVPYTNE